jgi:outer membrane protein OmpA-like peptidoglycan-associated protein
MFRDANATIEGETLTIEGKLRRGLSVDGANATFRNALPARWTLTTALTESAPLPQLVLSQRGEELLLSGVLPEGLDPVEALDAFPDTAGADGLTTGGEGSAEDWRTTLDGTAQGLVFFDAVTGRIAKRRIELDGKLSPGYTSAQAVEWITPRVTDGWTVIVSAEEVAATEGATRSSLTAEGTETFRRGFWMPGVDFPVSEARCKVEVTRILSDGKINFITASARIDQEGRTLLNRLAAVAVRCLNGSDLTLEIAGHTDASGSDEANLKLSEQRALAVLDALIERGVDEASMRAVGYGETQPIASNDIPEGRAQNRRIAFDWTSTEN